MEKHECKQEDSIEKIFNKLDEISKNIAEGNKEQAITNQILRGSEDVPGLCGRVKALEKSVADLNNIKVVFLALGGIAVLFVGKISSIVAFLTNLLKG